ncbi:hypothetical protein [Paenibacillus sp. N3.4]|uniref:hypothetical protein n=1 Tax=Paenibacillus sp. N3.4 TaxID=2603222 RepID=UPI0011CC95C3|nr:hypothetical protein [Paenibacillus sp. N3.4]TXK75166.1 hypothetical protein FU659_27750 [Paenibacillus sp. N3.4]
MDAKVKQALEITLHNWRSMAGSQMEEAEPHADQFQSSFYLFIDALREWFLGLDKQPRNLDEFLKLTMIQEIVNVLPAPLYLNFETEAELIIEKTLREDEDSYD